MKRWEKHYITCQDTRTGAPLLFHCHFIKAERYSVVLWGCHCFTHSTTHLSAGPEGACHQHILIWEGAVGDVEHSKLTSSQQIKVRTLAFHHYYSIDSQPQMQPNMRRPGCYAIRVYKHKSTDKQEVTGENKDASRVKALHSLPDRGIKIIRTLVGSTHEQF